MTYLSSEYTSLTLAKVRTGTAKLPSEWMMWDVHHGTIEKHGGCGKDTLRKSPEEFVGAFLLQSLSDSWNACDRVCGFDLMVERGGGHVRWQAGEWNTQKVISLVCFRGEDD